MRALSRMLADLDLRYPAFSWTERVCSYSNPADLPSRNRLKEAMKRYCLDDGGVVKAPADLVNTLIQFHRSPYMLLTTTGENHWATYVTTHRCEIHTTKRHNRCDKLSYASLGDRTETANSPDQPRACWDSSRRSVAYRDFIFPAYTHIYMLHEYIYMYVRYRWFCFCVSCPTNFA